MELLDEITFDAVIAAYLQMELPSPRFSATIREQLERDGRAATVVTEPELTVPADNAYRRALLASYRAYLFDDLPAHTRWYRAQFTPEEVWQVRYIDYSYWNALSRGTRLPQAAVPSIQAGEPICGVPPDGLLAAAAALRAGAPFPPLILVGATPEGSRTVIEGHVRLTAYALAPECLPNPLEVLVGFAPECATI